jgi:hypothetical protein
MAMISASVGVAGANRPGDVRIVQERLNHFVDRLQIPPLAVDGNCGPATRAAIVDFQQDVVGMEAPDGRIDPGGRTWTALAAAAALECEVAAIRAVAKVESSRAAFDDRDRPTILYERHLFHRLTGGRFDGQSDLSNPEAGGYGTFASQYGKLERAYALDADAALKACSWGMFQILGQNHAASGFATVVDYVKAMCQSESAHLKAFVSFIKSNSSMRAALRERDWPGFARLYNGPQYHRNRYDERMAEAYSQFAGR